MTVSDHIQKVLKPNFAAAWEEVGDTFEKEETFALSSTKTLQGKNNFATSVLPDHSNIEPSRSIYYSRTLLHKLIHIKGQDPVFII